MENINIFEIKALIVVIEEKSISAAARKLNVTQPAVSKLVMRVEENYKIKIFDRNKNPWQLTTVGVIFEEYLINILKEHENLLQKIDDVVANRKGTFSFAALPYEDQHLLAKVFVSFYKKYPNFKIDVFLHNSKKMETWLIERRVDFANVILPVKDKNIKSIGLKEYEIIVCIPNDFLLEQKIKIPKEKELQEIDIALFQNKPFILHRPQFGFRNHENNIFQKSGFMPSKSSTVEVAQHFIGVSLSNNNIGISFLLDDVLKHIDKSLNASFFKIKNIRPKQTLGIAYLKTRKLSNVEKDFIKIMQENAIT